MAAAANDVTVKGGGSAAKIFWSWQSDYRWLQAKCRRCETEASIPLDCVRRPRDTPIWKLEASLKWDEAAQAWFCHADCTAIDR